jgi:hypothetical protein
VAVYIVSLISEVYLTWQVISVKESMSWLEDMTRETFTDDTFTGWIKEGSKKLTIDDETNFCDPNLLRNVLNSKVRKEFH